MCYKAVNTVTFSFKDGPRSNHDAEGGANGGKWNTARGAQCRTSCTQHHRYLGLTHHPWYWRPRAKPLKHR